MWGICLDGKAWEDGLFQVVVQYKIDNSKALVMSPKANYELDIKKCLRHFMKNLRFFLNLRPSDEGLSYMDSGVKSSFRQYRLADCAKKWCAFGCTEHSDEPLKTKIVFSIGFHDFRVSSPSYKSHLHNILLCHLPSGTAGKNF